MKKGWLAVISLAILLIIFSVSLVSVRADQANRAADETVRTRRQPGASPQVRDVDATLVEGNSAFAFDLYQALREVEGNLFYSPFSISLALAMTYAGARGETALQMAKALRFALPGERLHAALSSLNLELAQRGQGAQGKDGEGFRLNIVNAIWGQKGYQFLSTFLDLLAEHYGAGLRMMDFVSAPEESRITINDWVSDQTEERIKDLIPSGAIDPLTRMVLTNAIYFNAAWQHPFIEERTEDGPFYLLDGRKITMPMMRQTESFNYTEGRGYQAIELAYDGGELAMVIVLPQAGNFKAFEEALDAERVNAIIERLEHRRAALSMPKFEFESEFSLSQTLAAMGMPVALSAGADFSGMAAGPGPDPDPDPDLYIQNVFHKAFVSVDEGGTEAVAATAVVVGVTSLPEGEPVQVTVDRPFIFLIRDIETETILFIGRVVNPRP